MLTGPQLLSEAGEAQPVFTNRDLRRRWDEVWEAEEHPQLSCELPAGLTDASPAQLVLWVPGCA